MFPYGNLETVREIWGRNIRTLSINQQLASALLELIIAPLLGLPEKVETCRQVPSEEQFTGSGVNISMAHSLVHKQ